MICHVYHIHRRKDIHVREEQYSAYAEFEKKKNISNKIKKMSRSVLGLAGQDMWTWGASRGYKYKMRTLLLLSLDHE